jgi:hypothetical protein
VVTLAPSLPLLRGVKVEGFLAYGAVNKHRSLLTPVM